MPEQTDGYHITLMNVSKRVNSTKAPAPAGLRLPVLFKRPCSMDSPVIYIVYNALNHAPEWNYAFIEETETYYWITDITSLRANHWQVAMTIDYLATYRSKILTTPALIEYGFNIGADGENLRLQDSRQYVSNVPEISTATADIASDLVSETGFFVLSCVGSSGVVTYKLNQGQLQSLLTAINISWTAETAAMLRWELALPQFMNKLLYGGDAVSCIRNCFWVPFSDSAPFTSGSAEITLGDFHTGITAPIISPTRKVYRDTTLTIPWPVDDWKRMNCQIQVWIPFIGTIVIPINQCNDQTELKIRLGVTAVDGGVTCKVDCGDYNIYTGSTNVASSYAVGSSNVDPIKFGSAVVTTVGAGLVFGGALGMAAASIATGTAAPISIAATEAAVANVGKVAPLAGGAAAMGTRSALQNIVPLSQSVGAMQGASQMVNGTECKLTLLYYKPIDDAGFQGLYGHPVMRVSIPVFGYCKTQGFSVAIPGHAEHANAINAAMDAGVFIE